MADAVSMRLEVKGIPKLIRKLRAIHADVEEAVAASMLASAFVVSSAAKKRAPYLTGNLARSITPGVGTDPRGSAGPIIDTVGPLPAQSVSTIRGELQADGKAEAYVATNVSYAPPQEFFNKPFLRPALDENRDEVLKTYRTALEQVIRKAGGQ